MSAKKANKARVGGAHPKHPPCTGCGKALYKTMTKGKAVKKDDPWAFCRNEQCELHGKDQSASAEAAPAAAEEPAKKTAPKAAAATKAAPAAKTAPKAAPAPAAKPAGKPVAAAAPAKTAPKAAPKAAPAATGNGKVAAKPAPAATKAAKVAPKAATSDGVVVPEEFSESSEVFKKAYKRIVAALGKGSEYAKQIASLTLNMVRKEDSVDAYNALILALELEEKLGIKPIDDEAAADEAAGKVLSNGVGHKKGEGEAAHV